MQTNRRPVRAFAAIVGMALVIGIAPVFAANPPTTSTSAATPESRFPRTPVRPELNPFAWSGVTTLNHVTTKDNVYFITVDDGSAYSDELAQLLDSQTVPITAFLLTKWADRIEAFWLKRKHITYENHTHDHFYQPPLSFERQKEDICTASQIVKRITGSAPRFFRPPAGAYTRRTLRAVRACGIKYMVMWNASAAWGKLYTDTGKPLKRGDIVLLHAIRSLPTTLKVVLRAGKKQGLQPALLRDYLK